MLVRGNDMERATGHAHQRVFLGYLPEDVDRSSNAIRRMAEQVLGSTERSVSRQHQSAGRRRARASDGVHGGFVRGDFP